MPALSPALVTATEPSQLVELADPNLVSTPTKREDLKYVVGCALPPSITLYSQQETERFTFPGLIGLAPRWLHTGMTPEEERWVSACVFARTNYFGKHLDISLRAKSSPAPFLQVSPEEQKRFTLFEGGFFGNMFTKQPVAYVCQGKRSPKQEAAPVLKDRVCTKPSGQLTKDGKSLTSCQFILTGRCSDPASFIVNGESYREVIYTYLQEMP